MADKNLAKSRFRPGPTGLCEAVLFEFVGIEDESNMVAERRLIAGATLLEAVAYLVKSEPDFRTHTVTNLGVAVFLSGSPTA